MAESTGKRARGRHRATDAEPGRLADEVPADLRDALRREVEALGERYRAVEWTFADSTILMWTARRTVPSGEGRDRLVFTLDGRAAWVPPGGDPETVLGDLVRAGALTRSQVEWLLAEQAPRFGKGPWHFTPVGDQGWLCSRLFWFAGARHYLVSRTEQVRLLDGPIGVEEAAATLAAVLTERPGPATSTTRGPATPESRTPSSGPSMSPMKRLRRTA